MEQFEYIKGPARTNRPWLRPRGNRLNMWKKAFFKIPGIEKYEFWICGGALEEWKTWDTDITMFGEINDYDELENILVTATQLGFKHRQLIDIHWIDFEDEKAFLRAHHIVERIRNKEKIQYKRPEKMITISQKIMKNGKTYITVVKQRIRESNSLWISSRTDLSRKQYEKIEEGITYKCVPVEITPQLDFRDIIKDKR